MKEFDYRAHSVIGSIVVFISQLPTLSTIAQGVGVVGHNYDAQLSLRLQLRLMNCTLQFSSRIGYKSFQPSRTN